jgi:hypothetical protein
LPDNGNLLPLWQQQEGRNIMQIWRQDNWHVLLCLRVISNYAGTDKDGTKL